MKNSKSNFERTQETLRTYPLLLSLIVVIVVSALIMLSRHSRHHNRRTIKRFGIHHHRIFLIILVIILSCIIFSYVIYLLVKNHKNNNNEKKILKSLITNIDDLTKKLNDEALSIKLPIPSHYIKDYNELNGESKAIIIKECLDILNTIITTKVSGGNNKVLGGAIENNQLEKLIREYGILPRKLDTKKENTCYDKIRNLEKSLNSALQEELIKYSEKKHPEEFVKLICGESYKNVSTKINDNIAENLKKINENTEKIENLVSEKKGVEDTLNVLQTIQDEIMENLKSMNKKDIEDEIKSLFTENETYKNLFDDLTMDKIDNNDYNLEDITNIKKILEENLPIKNTTEKTSNADVKKINEMKLNLKNEIMKNKILLISEIIKLNNLKKELQDLQKNFDEKETFYQNFNETFKEYFKSLESENNTDKYKLKLLLTFLEEYQNLFNIFDFGDIENSEILKEFNKMLQEFKDNSEHTKTLNVKITNNELDFDSAIEKEIITINENLTNINDNQDKPQFINDLKNLLKTSIESLNNLKTKYVELNKELNEKNKELNETNTKLNEKNKELNETNTKLNDLNKELQDLQTKFDEKETFYQNFNEKFNTYFKNLKTDENNTDEDKLNLLLTFLQEYQNLFNIFELGDIKNSEMLENFNTMLQEFKDNSNTETLNVEITNNELDFDSDIKEEINKIEKNSRQINTNKEKPQFINDLKSLLKTSIESLNNLKTKYVELHKENTELNNKNIEFVNLYNELEIIKKTNIDFTSRNKYETINNLFTNLNNVENTLIKDYITKLKKSLLDLYDLLDKENVSLLRINENLQEEITILTQKINREKQKFIRLAFKNLVLTAKYFTKQLNNVQTMTLNQFLDFTDQLNEELKPRVLDELKNQTNFDNYYSLFLHHSKFVLLNEIKNIEKNIDDNDYKSSLENDLEKIKNETLVKQNVKVSNIQKKFMDHINTINTETYKQFENKVNEIDFKDIEDNLKKLLIEINQSVKLFNNNKKILIELIYEIKTIYNGVINKVLLIMKEIDPSSNITINNILEQAITGGYTPKPLITNLKYIYSFLTNYKIGGSESGNGNLIDDLNNALNLLNNFQNIEKNYIEENIKNKQLKNILNFVSGLEQDKIAKETQEAKEAEEKQTQEAEKKAKQEKEEKKEKERLKKEAEIKNKCDKIEIFTKLVEKYKTIVKNKYTKIDNMNDAFENYTSYLNYMSKNGVPNAGNVDKMIEFYNKKKKEFILNEEDTKNIENLNNKIDEIVGKEIVGGIKKSQGKKGKTYLDQAQDKRKKLFNQIKNNAEVYKIFLNNLEKNLEQIYNKSNNLCNSSKELEVSEIDQKVNDIQKILPKIKDSIDEFLETEKKFNKEITIMVNEKIERNNKFLEEYNKLDRTNLPKLKTFLDQYSKDNLLNAENEEIIEELQQMKLIFEIHDSDFLSSIGYDDNLKFENIKSDDNKSYIENKLIELYNNNFILNNGFYNSGKYSEQKGHFQTYINQLSEENLKKFLEDNKDYKEMVSKIEERIKLIEFYENKNLEKIKNFIVENDFNTNLKDKLIIELNKISNYINTYFGGKNNIKEKNNPISENSEDFDTYNTMVKYMINESDDKVEIDWYTNKILKQNILNNENIDIRTYITILYYLKIKFNEKNKIKINKIKSLLDIFFKEKEKLKKSDNLFHLLGETYFDKFEFKKEFKLDNLETELELFYVIIYSYIKKNVKNTYNSICSSETRLCGDSKWQYFLVENIKDFNLYIVNEVMNIYNSDLEFLIVSLRYFFKSLDSTQKNYNSYKEDKKINEFTFYLKRIKHICTFFNEDEKNGIINLTQIQYGSLFLSSHLYQYSIFIVQFIITNLENTEITIDISKTIIDGIITYHQSDDKLSAAELQKKSIEEKTKEFNFENIKPISAGSYFIHHITKLFGF